jgi:hypothetical protein
VRSGCSATRASRAAATGVEFRAADAAILVGVQAFAMPAWRRPLLDRGRLPFASRGYGHGGGEEGGSPAWPGGASSSGSIRRSAAACRAWSRKRGAPAGVDCADRPIQRAQGSLAKHPATLSGSDSFPTTHCPTGKRGIQCIA